MKQLRCDGPTIDPTAKVTASNLGRWTEVGARTSIVESTLDDYSYVVHDAEIIFARIGRFCSIAAHTRINPGNHPLDRVALHHFTYRSAQYGMAPDDASFFDWRRGFGVDIGHDVWIGHGAIVLPGVTIGTGAAVGAGAVVRHDVDPFTVVAGVPARPIRRRFSDETVADLLALAWWNWPDDRIGQALPDFRDLGAEAFVVKYRGT